MGYLCLPIYLSLCVLAAMPAEDEHVHHSFRYHTSYGSSQNMETLTFSPDSRYLAVSVGDQVDFIETQQGEILHQFRGSPFSMKFTDDGKRLYMISRSEARLLDVQSGSVIPTQYNPITSSPGINVEERNGKLLVKSLVRGSSADASEALQVGDEIVAFSDGQNGEMERITGWSLESTNEHLQGYAGTFLRLKVMPKGRYGAKNEKTLTLRRNTPVGTGRSGVPLVTGQRALPKALVWCMAGKRSWHEFRDAATGNPVAHLETIDIQNVGLYAISPDQTRFAVVARRKDRQGNAVEVYDLASQERLAFIPLSTSYYDITFASDNNRVLIGTWDTIQICDTAKATVVSSMTLGYQMPEKGDSGQTVGGIGLQALMEVRAQVLGGSSSEGGSPRQLVSKLAVSAKNTVAVGDSEGNISLWDLASNRLLTNIPAEQKQAVEHLQFSPDGHWLAYYVGGSLHLENISKLSLPKTTSEDSSQTNAGEIATDSLVSGVLPK
jgi:WD40 repeat protein